MPQTRASARPARRFRTPLHQGWTVERTGETAPDSPQLPAAPFAATVPGCVHTDLLDAGLIEDPLLDRHELDAAWVAETAWRYTCTFTADAARSGEMCELACDGIDTSATLTLNGITLGTVCNMHTRVRFDVRAALRPGANTLQIDFEAPMALIRRLAAEHGEMPHEGAGSNQPHPHNAARKMACAFGWDWGPVLPSAGIWRPIALERWRTARLGTVRPLVTRADAAAAEIRVHPDLIVADSPAADASIEIIAELRDPEGRPVDTVRVHASPGQQPAIRLHTANPRLWWPAGYGDQPLYTVTTSLHIDGEETDHHECRVGLRTVELIDQPDDQTDDQPDPRPADATAPARTTDEPPARTMHLKVNGQRVYCKGANWIPDDPFPTRITPERYRHRVTLAKRANMNMLRVWGGGIYEDKAFYDACDELGIMVWQDFLCACAAYHEHEPYRSWFEAEARDNVARLSPHASLVLWCGNNECLEAIPHWGPFKPLRDDPSIPWGLHYYFELFPAVVADLDPTRPYWPGSPHTPDAIDRPRIESSGDVHIWDVWNGAGDAKRYLTHAPRFASEFGFHGPPTWPTLRQAIPEDQRRYDSPAMIHHNKHAGGQPLANTRMADYFVPPANFDDWLYLAQIVQARSLALGCEWFRALSPWCSGALYWQFNDMWPVSSWSAVDGQGRPKPLWFATKRFFRPRLVTVRPANPVTGPMNDANEFGPLAVYLHNDHPEPWEGRLLAEERDLTGAVHTTALDQPFRVEPRACLRLPLPADARGHPGLLTASTGTSNAADRAYWFPTPDKDLAYPIAKMDFELERNDGHHELHVRAHSLVRDLCFFPDRLCDDAAVSDQMITLLPGDETTIWFKSTRPIELRELVAPPVMQSANRFGATRPVPMAPGLTKA
jgi:beta-mannosidase